MKTLSVNFYKRLILLLLALLILIPTVLAVVFGVQNRAFRRQLAEGTPPEPPQTGVADPEDWQKPQAEPIEYQELYPELYSTAKIAAERIRESNTVYLTFDCVPNANTESILDVLDDWGIKATFFVSGSADAEALSYMRAIVNRGHSIGLRGYSDSYQQIYGSVSSYLEDFKGIYDLVYESTGVKAEIFRFPGGSVNAYNSGLYQELSAEMLRRGFIFFDWNVSGEASGIGESTADQIQSNVLSGMEGKDRGIVMLRDTEGKENMTAALPGIIEELQSRGYAFRPLTAEILPVVFSYKGAA